jgi:biotin synthase
MSEEEIFLSAQKACSLGYKTVVLQSGEDEYYRTVMLCRLIERIKGEFDCAVTLSIGERDYSDYRQLREAGADRYLLKFETSDETLFAGLKSDSCYQRRLQSINQLKQLGYQIGSGNIVGLPGQTLSSLADNLLLIEELDLDMAGIGPFIPHPNTPLASAAGGNLLDSLKILALTRIIMGDVHLPATTALGSIDSQGRQKALQCGANVIMPDITPEEYRPHYEIYPGRICIEDNPDECAGYIKSMVSLLGRKIAEDKGDSLRKPGVNSWNTGN